MPALVLAAIVLVPASAFSQVPQGSNTRVLGVAAPWEIGSLDPSKAGYVFSRLEVSETLVDVDAQGALAGGLARTWEVSKDQLTWRFKLRPNAKFHDGTPVTAEVALRSLERAKANPGVLGNTPIKRMTAQGDVVVIELSKAFASLPAFLAHTSTQVLALSSFNPDGSVKAVIGSGPYRITSLSPPQKLEVQYFEGYDGAAPAVRRISYLAAGRGETRGMLAESGQVDLVFTHDAAAIARLKQKPGVTFHTLPIPRTIYLKVNAGHPLLKDVNVRRAISLVIDRDGIAGAILREPKAAATQLFPAILAEWSVPALPPLKRDLSQARALLQAAGWQSGADNLLRKDGKPFNLTLRTFSDRPELPPMAAAIQAQLKEVGINLQVSVGNSSEIPAGHQDGTLELALLARNYSLVPDPLGTLLQDFAANGGDWGAMGWSSASVRSSLESLSTQVDPARRSALRGSLATVLQAELPVIPIAWYQHTATSSKRLGNVSIDPMERSYRISQMRWAQ
ncbi:ABC transporter substrate-binding protein [Polaromonas aquatica]|uniref:ABC transporter substrate-binding protein n=1 Tax=Polaromonas aquatica TaxID=332657 RepID=UPI003D65B475